MVNFETNRLFCFLGAALPIILDTKRAVRVTLRPGLRLSYRGRRRGRPYRGGSMDENEELERLLAEAREGETQARDELLTRLRPWLRRRAEGVLGQRLRAREDGSDIVQDALIRVFEHFGQFQGDSVAQLRGWVEVILNNVITDCRRRHGAGKRDARKEKGGENGIPDVPEDLRKPVSKGQTPLDAALRVEDQARVIQALQLLPDRYRLVLQLRYYDELPFEEVARKVGVTVEHARVLRMRAIEKLGDALGDEHENK
jgi:RNA polymerase sigma-70 factor (ECF subfamily)